MAGAVDGECWRLGRMMVEERGRHAREISLLGRAARASGTARVMHDVCCSMRRSRRQPRVRRLAASMAPERNVWCRGDLHSVAVAAVTRITGGNFRLIQRLFEQIERILQINNLRTVTKEVVEAARDTLVIGPL